MPTIESRVVEMRFDNKQFEDNAQQSMDTIKKLNKSLDFDKTSKGLDKLSDAGKKFSLKGMEVALQTVTEKFSAMEIAGMQVIANLTNQFTNMGMNFVKSMTTDLIGAGWNKYAEKTSAVQTIMASTAKEVENEGDRMKYVNEQIEKLNWFTDETSYSLIDMTSNIGKFTSNGIKLDAAATQMQGISVWASLSGASLQDASRAMYNLSQAMASGKVMAIDWKSIENANMATREFKETAIATAVELGTLVKKGDEYYDTTGKALKVTENFRETLSAGWFTSDVLAKTLDTYGSFTNELYEFTNEADIAASEAMGYIDDFANGTLNMKEAMASTQMSAEDLTKYLTKLSSAEMDLGRRAFRAAQEAKTFQEAIDATAEAVGSTWMQSFEYMFGDYLHAKQNWTALAEELYDLFVEPGNTRNNILRIWADEFSEEGGYGALMRAVDNAWTGIKRIGSTISDAFQSIFNPFYDFEYGGTDIEKAAEWLINVTKTFESYTKSFVDYFAEIAEEAQEIMEPMEEVAEEAVKVVDTVSKTQEVLDDLVGQVIRGDWGNGQDRVDALRAEGYSYELVQNKVNELLGYEKRYEVQSEELVESQEKVAESVSDTAKTFAPFAGEINKTGEVTESAADKLREVSEATETLTPAQKRLDILRSTFVAIFEVIDWGKRIVDGIIKVVSHTVIAVLKKLEAPFWNILGAITDFFEVLRENFDIGGAITSFFDGLIPIIDGVLDAIERFVLTFKSTLGFMRFVESLKRVLGMIGDMVGKLFGKLSDGAKEIDWVYTVDVVLGHVSDALEWLANKLADVLDYIADHQADIEAFFGTFSSTVAGGITAVAEAFGALWGYISGSTPVANGMFDLSFIAEFVTMIDWTTLKNAGDSLKDFGVKLWEMLQNIDWDTIGKLAAGGGLAVLGYMIYDFCTSLAKSAKAIMDIPQDVGKVVKNFASDLKASANEKNSRALVNVAKAIGIFALALIGLSFIDQSTLEHVVSMMVIIMGMVALIMAVYAKMKNASKEQEGLVDTLLKPFKDFMDKVSTTLDKTANIAKIGIGLVAIVAAIGLLGMVAKSLREIDWMSFLDGAGKIAILGALLVAGGAALSKFAQNINLGTGLALIGMAAAIFVISKAIIPLSTLNLQEMGIALLGIAGIMAGLSFMAQSVDGTNLLGFAAGMVVLGAALALMVPTIISLALLPFAKLAQGVGAIAAIVVVLAGMSVLMATFGGTGDELIALAAALILLTAPLVVVGMYAKEAGYGLLILVGALAALLGAGFIAQYVAFGLVALTDAAIGLGVGAVMFGVGMLGIAAAIYIVAKAIPVIIDSLIYISQVIPEHGEEIIFGLTVLLTSIAGAIANSAVHIATSIVIVILEICNQIVAALPVISGKIFELLVGVLVFLASVMGQLCEAIIQLIIALFNGIANGIRNNAQPLLESVVNILDAIWDLVIECIAGIVNMIPGVGGLLADNVRDLKDWVVPAAQDTGNSVNEAIKNTANATGLGETIEADANNELASVDLSSGIASFTSGYEGMFSESFSGVDMSGIMSGNIDSATLESLTSFETSGETSGNALLDSIVSTIDDREPDVETSMSNNISTAGAASGTQATTSGQTNGNNWVAGLISGITSRLVDLEGAGYQSGAAIERGYRSATLTKSPSRIGMLMGKFWDQGIAAGVKNNIGIVSESGEESGNTLANALRGTIDRVSEWLNTDMDLNPTISPVLDLSNVQNGMNTFDGIFGQRSMNLALAGANITTRDMMLNAEMAGIKNDISELSNSINNLAEAQNNQTYEFIANTNLDGRNIARSTARYNRQELALLDRNANRRGGKVR